MNVKNLFNPVLEQGILHTNFFEGRLLTAEDIRDQQDANREHDRRLGRAIGQGIIEGLEVELDSDGSDGTPPVVTVKKGLAINAQGEIIGLPSDDIKLALSRSLETVKLESADFYQCAGPPNNQHVPNGVGVYILVMSPTAAYKERAPKSGLGDGGDVKGCGSRYIQEGVQFRLVEFSPTSMTSISKDTRDLLSDDFLSQSDPATKSDLPRLSKLRNLLAHIFFGTDSLVHETNTPSLDKYGETEYMTFGALNNLQQLNELNNCDVPLALFYWTLDGIAFHDMWSVRRRPVYRQDVDANIDLRIHNQAIDAEAIRFQFQAQLQTILSSSTDLSNLKVLDYFYLLPSVGYLPLQTATQPKGFVYKQFFDDVKVREPVFIDAARLLPVIKHIVTYWPINPSNQELIWLYKERQNQQSIDAGETSGVVDYLVFATGHAPYAGNARFDVARWDYSNYGFI